MSGGADKIKFLFHKPRLQGSFVFFSRILVLGVIPKAKDIPNFDKELTNHE